MNDFEENTKNFTTQEKLQLLTKIEQIKYEVSEADLKKSGKNTYQKYNYFELKDFMPLVRKLCIKYKVATQFNVIDDTAYLHVFDTETNCFRRWSHKIPKVETLGLNKTGEMIPIKETEQEKVKGALETYSRRYLYLAFLELTDGDPIDSGDVDAQKKTTKQKKKYPTPKEVYTQLKEELGDDLQEKAEITLTQMVTNHQTTEGIKKLVMDMVNRGE